MILGSRRVSFLTKTIVFFIHSVHVTITDKRFASYTNLQSEEMVMFVKSARVYSNCDKKRSLSIS